MYDFESNYLDLEIKIRHEADSVVGHEKRDMALKQCCASSLSELKVLEAMLTATVLIPRCASGCQLPRVEIGIGNSFAAVAEA